MVLLIFGCATALHGADTMLQGIQDYMAGSSDLATAHFREHLREKISEEERQVTLYNLATSLASTHAYESARKIFEEIDPRSISSKIVYEALLTNEALLLIKIGKPDSILEAETIAKELNDSLRARVLEEAAIARMQLASQQVKYKPIALQEEIAELFWYLKGGGDDALYFKQVRAFVPEAAGSSWDLLTSLLQKSFADQTANGDLLAALEFYMMLELDEMWPVFQKEKTRCREAIRQLIDRKLSRAETLENALLKILKSHLREKSAKELLQIYKLFYEKEEALYQMIFEDRVDAKYAHEVLYEKLRFSDKKEAASYLNQAKKSGSEKEALLLSWLSFDKESCLKYQLSHFSATRLSLFLFSWKKIRESIQPPARVKAVDELSQLLQDFVTKKQDVKVLLLALQYWLFYDQQKDGSALLPFGVQFERQAIGVQRGDASVARRVTLELLQKVQNMKLSASLAQETKVVQSIVQENAQFEMQRAIHSRVVELLEKIARVNQKRENENKSDQEHAEDPKSQDRASMKPVNLKIGAEDALQLLQNMQELDQDDKKPMPASTSGVEYPW